MIHACLSCRSAFFPQVRIVYFPAANTHENVEFQAKLGIQTYYAAPLQFPSFVQLNGALHKTQPKYRCTCVVFSSRTCAEDVLLLTWAVHGALWRWHVAGKA